MITITAYGCAAYLCRTGRIPGHVEIIRKPAVTIAAIQACVAEGFEIPQMEMKSARRSRKVARPRQVAMYLSRQLTKRSLPEIGQRFGHRDHTTVIHAIRQIERICSVDEEFRDKVQGLQRELEAS